MTATEPTFCPECGYDLRGIPEERCPECGFGFQHAAVRSLVSLEADRQLFAYRQAAWLACVTVCCVILGSWSLWLRWLLLILLTLSMIALLATGVRLGRGISADTVATLMVVALVIMALYICPALLYFVGLYALLKAFWTISRTPRQRPHALEILDRSQAVRLRRWRVAAWAAVSSAVLGSVIALTAR